MYLKTQIYQSHHLIMIRMVFVILVLGLSFLADLAWWQYLVIVMVASFCMFWQNRFDIQTISTDNPKDLWQLGIDYDDDIEIFQAYLCSVTMINFGFWKVIKLDFYINEPILTYQTMFLSDKNISAEDFCKLSALAKFGGY